MKNIFLSYFLSVHGYRYQTLLNALLKHYKIFTYNQNLSILFNSPNLVTLNLRHNESNQEFILNKYNEDYLDTKLHLQELYKSYTNSNLPSFFNSTTDSLFYQSMKKYHEFNMCLKNNSINYLLSLPNFENKFFSLAHKNDIKKIVLNDGFFFLLQKKTSFILNNNYTKIHHPDYVITDNAIETYCWKKKLADSSISTIKFLETGTPLDSVASKPNLNSITSKDYLTITFFTSWIACTYDPNEVINSQIKMYESFNFFLMAVNKIQKHHKINVIIKLHPRFNNTFSGTSQLLNSLAKKYKIKNFKVTISDLSSVVSNTDIAILNAFSSVLNDLILANIPIITFPLHKVDITNDFYTIPEIDMLFHNVNTALELEEKLNHFLIKKNRQLNKDAQIEILKKYKFSYLSSSKKSLNLIKSLEKI